MMESAALTEFGESTMHASAFLLGTGHYILVSVSIIVDEGAITPLSWHWMDIIQFVVGTALFLVASMHQMKCHVVLMAIKSKGGYGLPSGGWFELTWSPLYLAEVLLYVSLVFVTQCRNQNVIWIALWVAVNQSISAIRTKEWYLKTFPQAAAMRRATLIPYVW
ncbi:unnamed protein product [Aphanomyces euteiches]